MIKIWMDEEVVAPIGYRWYYNADEAINAIKNYLVMWEFSGYKPYYKIEIIDIPFNSKEGIKLSKWLETYCHYDLLTCTH